MLMASRTARNVSRRCFGYSTTFGVKPMITQAEIIWIIATVLVAVVGAVGLCLLLWVMK